MRPSGLSRMTTTRTMPCSALSMLTCVTAPPLGWAIAEVAITSAKAAARNLNAFMNKQFPEAPYLLIIGRPSLGGKRSPHSLRCNFGTIAAATRRAHGLAKAARPLHPVKHSGKCSSVGDGGGRRHEARAERRRDARPVALNSDNRIRSLGSPSFGIVKTWRAKPREGRFVQVLSGEGL